MPKASLHTPISIESQMSQGLDFAEGKAQHTWKSCQDQGITGDASKAERQVIQPARETSQFLRTHPSQTDSGWERTLPVLTAPVLELAPLELAALEAVGPMLVGVEATPLLVHGGSGQGAANFLSPIAGPCQHLSNLKNLRIHDYVMRVHNPNGLQHLHVWEYMIRFPDHPDRHAYFKKALENGGQGQDDDDDAHACNAQTVSCAQSPLPPSSPPTYESDDSAHPVGDVVHPCQEGGLIYTRLQKKGKGRAIDAKDIDAANHSDCDTQLTNLKKMSRQWQKNLANGTGGLHATYLLLWDLVLRLLIPKLMKPTSSTHGIGPHSPNQMVEYNTLMIGIPKDDFATRREKFKAVYEWSESSSAIPTNQSVKSIAARVDNAKTQFSGLVEVWSNLEDIEIVGVVMYVGQDPAGYQTSGIFGGSETIRNFINENGIDVQSLMDKYTTIFKCLRNSDGADARVAGTGSIGDVGSVLELHCCTKETLRDCNHRVFGSMMKEKMLAALRDLHVTCGIEVSDPQKVSWHQLLKFLQKSHLTIVNWTHSVSPLGPAFKYKKLKAGPFCQLVVPYLWRKLGLLYDRQTNDEEEQDRLDDVLEIEIKCWNEEVINILDADPLKGEITLINATDGTVFQQISDDPEWKKSLKEMDHQQQGIEYLLTFARLYSLTIKLHHAINAGMIYVGIIFQAILTCERLAQPSSLFPDDKHYLLATTINFLCLAKDSIMFHLKPTILTTTSGEPHWVNRGNAAQYEDDFAEEYINEDYY
ncbi:hypothetical protein F5J12DRAFT_787887 [Pisolithus orientalis]|uniref:uncharacterized protein n=1 Tax=Pisolithus orientalis TaxID=936130 RepID=UPI00222548E4|nr:uncharacterized protein F5J12DRAFT_787887 [Pisolithus orientalis]KAI5983323.1 hypothetical protein F5J12DRAFT_787887 [Pisolithus orientalis]